MRKPCLAFWTYHVFHRPKTGYMALSTPVLESVKKMNRGVGENMILLKIQILQKAKYLSTNSSRQGLFFTPLFMGFDENRDEGGKIFYDADIGHIENGCFGICVNGNDKA